VLQPSSKVQVEHHRYECRNIEDANLKYNIEKSNDKMLDDEHEDRSKSDDHRSYAPSLKLIFPLHLIPAQKKRKCVKVATATAT